MINDHVLSLINLESLRDFEIRSGMSIDHERFRANIVLNSFLEFKYENFIQNLYFNYFIFNKRYS